MAEAADRVAEAAEGARQSARRVRASSVSLRAARPQDEPFLLELYASTRAAELALVGWSEDFKRGFVRQQFEAQSRHYREYFPDASHDLIVVDGEPAGRLYVDRGPTEIRVVDIALLPAYRGQGIGGELLRDVQAQAAASGRAVTIHVERFNPAQRLYARLGFEAVDAEGPVYLRLSWTAQPS